MSRFVRNLMVVVSVVQLFFAAAFFFQWPIATGMWPFEGTTPLTYIFVASIFAAAAASTLWAVLSGRLGALAGIGLDYLVILTAMAVVCFSEGFIALGAASVFGSLFGLALLIWGARQPLDETIRMPGPVRWAFVFFVIALWIVGGRLALKVPNSIPWGITPELSVVIGWMFLGASAYFVYGLLRPSWANAGGQLMGFLAYDVVLIVPFLTRLPTTTPEHRLGLTIYTGVVALSGLVAIYYLFVHAPTRLLGKQAVPATA
ncbi:MAG TPA: hypothetical protein VMN57_09810 [Anaerolineales bacterium]|nr:hypothetical protein [Anaerolineales bacterium]